jgi:hypothetical protein
MTKKKSFEIFNDIKKGLYEALASCADGIDLSGIREEGELVAVSVKVTGITLAEITGHTVGMMIDAWEAGGAEFIRLPHCEYPIFGAPVSVNKCTVTEGEDNDGGIFDIWLDIVFLREEKSAFSKCMEAIEKTHKCTHIKKILTSRT